MKSGDAWRAWPRRPRTCSSSTTPVTACSTSGGLHLAVCGTNPDLLPYTAVPYEWIRGAMVSSPAAVRVVILDCCFSGRAVEAMSAPASLAAGQAEIAGTYTLTSTSANAPSSAPVGEDCTAFTGELVALLRHGVDDYSKPLTLTTIYRCLDRVMLQRGLPRPQQRAVNAASDLVLSRAGPSFHQSPPPTSGNRSTKQYTPQPVPKAACFNRHRPSWFSRVSWAFILILALMSRLLFALHNAGAGFVLSVVAVLLMVGWAVIARRIARVAPRRLVVSAQGLELLARGKHFSIPWRHVDQVRPVKLGWMLKLAVWLRPGYPVPENSTEPRFDPAIGAVSWLSLAARPLSSPRLRTPVSLLQV
jgi:hypothetical protein